MLHVRLVIAAFFVLTTTHALATSAAETDAVIGVESAAPPNIVFIMADDLGYGNLGCFGQKEMLTPNIDGLAASGMRFTQCYSGSTVCAPSRCSLLTGKHNGHARVRGNAGWAGKDRVKTPELPLEDDDVTIAEVLKKSGYATGATGKWGVGQPGTSGMPTRQGFDEFLGFLNQRHAHGYYPEYIWRNETMISLDQNLGRQQNDWIHDRMTEFALDFIRENQQQPFFLYVPYTIPHGRYEVPTDNPYSDRDWPQPLRSYAAMITRMDTDVGKMLQLIEDLKIIDNTLVFFTSDNGAEIYYFREHDLVDVFDETLNSRGGLTGWKRDLTDGGIRVPMIASWPGHIPAGQTSEFVCALYDILPTLADVAGTTPPPGIDGQSILPTLLGGTQAAHEFLYWEFFERGFQQAVRHGPYKAIRLKQGKPLQLFNIMDDPGEQIDIAGRHPDVIAKVEDYLKTARTDSPFWP